MLNNNIKDTNLYINLCTKITCGNLRDNVGNTRGDDDNTRGRSCQLKLNDIDYHIIPTYTPKSCLAIHVTIVTIHVEIMTIHVETMSIKIKLYGLPRHLSCEI